MFRSIAIELNVPRDEFSSTAIELIFVTFGRGFKNAGSVLFDISDSWDKDLLNPITSVYICITWWCYWKLSIFKIIDKRIEFYSQNTNYLPPKPKSSFRHLKQGIQEFHRKYVLVPADKAANNVIVG